MVSDQDDIDLSQHSGIVQPRNELSKKKVHADDRVRNFYAARAIGVIVMVRLVEVHHHKISRSVRCLGYPVDNSVHSNDVRFEVIVPIQE